MKNKEKTLRFYCPGREDSRLLAASLAPFLKAGQVLTLEGGLGAGKTAFVTDLAEALGFAPEEVSSPTFTLVQEYRNPAAPFPIYHFDVYRLDDAEAFWAAGLDEYFGRDGLCLIEWPGNIREALPEERIRVEISCEGSLLPEDFDFSAGAEIKEDCRPRRFCFSARGAEAAAVLAAWEQSPDFPESAAVPETDTAEEKRC